MHFRAEIPLKRLIIKRFIGEITGEKKSLFFTVKWTFFQRCISQVHHQCGDFLLYLTLHNTADTYCKTLFQIPDIWQRSVSRLV